IYIGIVDHLIIYDPSVPDIMHSQAVSPNPTSVKTIARESVIPNEYIVLVTLNFHAGTAKSILGDTVCKRTVCITYPCYVVTSKVMISLATPGGRRLQSGQMVSVNYQVIQMNIRRMNKKDPLFCVELG